MNFGLNPNNNIGQVDAGPKDMRGLTDRKHDQQRFTGNGEAEQGKRGVYTNEDQFFKKQMEFKGGKRHQLITD